MLLSLVPVYNMSGSSPSNEIGVQSDQPSNSFELLDTLDNTLDLNLPGAHAFLNRSMSALRTGQLTVNDSIRVTIEESSNTTISMLNYSIPTVFAEKIVYIEFYSQLNGTNLLRAKNHTVAFKFVAGAEITTYFIPVTVNGTTYRLTEHDTFNVKAYIVLDEILTYDFYDNAQKSFLNYSLLPLLNNLPINVSKLSLSIIAQTDVKMGEPVSYPHPFDNETSNWNWVKFTQPRFNVTVGLQYTDFITMAWTSTKDFSGFPDSTVPITSTKSDRYVKIDPWGGIEITETLTVEHIGAPNFEPYLDSKGHGLYGIGVLVPNDAKVLDVYDDLSRLNIGTKRDKEGYPTTTQSNSPLWKQLNVQFRFPIFGEEEYTFTVKYTLTLEEWMTKSGKDYELTLSLWSLFNWTLHDYTMKVELPIGATFEGIDYFTADPYSSFDVSYDQERRVLSPFKSRVVVITASQLAGNNNKMFVLSYSMNSIEAFIVPIMLILFSMIALAGYVIIRALVSTDDYDYSQITSEDLPAEEISLFVRLYGDKIAITRRITNLRGNFQRKKVTKREYDGQMTSYQERQKMVSARLSKVKAQLMTFGSRYENAIQKIEVAEQRKSDVLNNERQLVSRYRRQDVDMTRDAYLKLRRDYQREIDQQDTIISRTINEMRMIIERA